MDYFRQCSCLETNPCVLVFTISLSIEEVHTTLYGSAAGCTVDPYKKHVLFESMD